MVELSEATCTATYFQKEEKTDANKDSTQNATVNKVESLIPSVSINQVTDKSAPTISDKTVSSEGFKQKASEPQPIARYRYRQNDKLLSSDKTRQSSNSILAYTGDMQIKHIKDLSNEREDMIKYKIQHTYPLPRTDPPDTATHSPNLFYAGSNLDNPYLTWVTVPRWQYTDLQEYCHPLCHIGSILRGDRQAEEDGQIARSGAGSNQVLGLHTDDTDGQIVRQLGGRQSRVNQKWT